MGWHWRLLGTCWWLAMAALVAYGLVKLGGSAAFGVGFLVLGGGGAYLHITREMARQERDAAAYLQGFHSTGEYPGHPDLPRWPKPISPSVIALQARPRQADRS